MPSRPILQACAKSVGPSPSICSASAANVGFVFVLLQRVAHALGVGEGCAVTASYPEVRSDHQHANPFRTAPSLCADMIFGKDKATMPPWKQSPAPGAPARATAMAPPVHDSAVASDIL